MINPTKNTNSIPNKRKNKAKSAKITNVFINIPIAIEKPTNPWRYSFFQGLKYVLRRSGSEKSSKKALFNELKNVIKIAGASINQNFKKTRGNKNKPFIGQLI